MKTRNQFSTKKVGSFAKAKLLATMLCIVAATAIIGCKPEPEPTTPAHVHQFGTEWKKDATQHWHECSCGEKADIANHTWAWTVTTPATPTADGEETRTCSACGETQTRAIDKLEEQPKDQTATLTNLFGEGLSTNITGYLTDSEWEGIATKIETALNNAFNAGPTTPPPLAASYKNRFRLVFNATSGYNIKVVKTLESDGWSKWKVTESEWDTKKLLLGFGKLDTGLQQSITDAVTAIATGKPGMDGATVQPDTPRTLTFPTTENPNNTYSVTITSEEQFTADQWKTHCDNVVTAIMRGHDKYISAVGLTDAVNKNRFKTVFAVDQNTIIVIMPNSVTYNCEVRGDNYRKMYLKVGAIDTIDLELAVKFMFDKNGELYQQ